MSARMSILVCAAHLLGADVIGRADRHAGLGEPPLFVVGQAGQAQVGELDAPLLGEDHVLGLDVAVDQPALGGVLERLGDRQRDP